MCSLKGSWEDSWKLPATNEPTTSPNLKPSRLEGGQPRQKEKGSIRRTQSGEREREAGCVWISAMQEQNEGWAEAGHWLGPRAEVLPLLTLLSPIPWSLQLFLEQFWLLQLLSASARREPLVNYSSQRGREARRRNLVTGWGKAVEKSNSVMALKLIPLGHGTSSALRGRAGGPQIRLENVTNTWSKWERFFSYTWHKFQKPMEEKLNNKSIYHQYKLLCDKSKAAKQTKTPVGWGWGGGQPRRVHLLTQLCTRLKWEEQLSTGSRPARANRPIFKTKQKTYWRRVCNKNNTHTQRGTDHEQSYKHAKHAKDINKVNNNRNQAKR